MNFCYPHLEGTFPLPEAQVDRFIMRIIIGYPTQVEENVILECFNLSDPLPDLGAVTTPDEIIGSDGGLLDCTVVSIIRLGFEGSLNRIYALLLEMSEKLDHPPLTSQTPLEFLPILNRLFPSSRGGLTTITEAYLNVSYGELSESTLDLKGVESAWDRLMIQGREMLAIRRHKKY
jgi:hypothetical protein